MKKMKRACSNGDLSLLNRAVEHVDVNASLGGGWPPLSLAAAAGHADIARVLLKRGADAKIGLPSPLEFAAKSGHVACIKALITYSTVECIGCLREGCSRWAPGRIADTLNHNSELLFDLTHSALQ